MKIAVGIDLGTTNSLVAHSENQMVTVLADESGKKIIPSVLAITKNHDFLVGNKAKAMRGNSDAIIISSVKRLMGRSVKDATNIPHLEQFIDKNQLDSVTLNIYGKEITPIEVSSEILKRLRSIAESSLDCSEVEAVITVPAYFDEAQRQATKQAAQLAGLNVLRIINEPTAAALAYGLNQGEEGIYVIYDFGGGTFDVSVLRMQKGLFQVLATGGDTNLGGDDIDILLAKALLKKVSTTVIASLRSGRSNPLEGKIEWIASASLEPRNDGYAEGDFKNLINHACEVKERLSNELEVKIRIGDSVVTFSRAELNEIIEPLIMRTIAITKEAMKDQKDIHGVVLVGGSTRIPLVKESIRKIISDKIYDDFNPDEIVAIGAALQAENLTKGSNNLLLDVTPLSLGIELLGGINEKIIHRNTLIPVLASHEFTTHQDGQTGIKIHIVQGEREMAKDCRSLAHLEVKNIPTMKAGLARVKISFIIDADGLLTVEAKEQTTGATQRVEIIASHGLSSDKVESMLRDALKYSKEDEEAKLKVESIIHAEEIIFKIEKAMTEDPELVNRKDAQALKSQIFKIRGHIKARDRHLVDNAVIRLEQISHSFIERKIDKYLNAALRGVNIKDK